MALNKFFRYPFAVAGDKTAVPDPTQVSGAVSWQQGYGPQYELPYTDPNARDIERNQNNQLHYDITTALQEYQTNGVPDWIDPAQNGAANYAYPLGARVRYTDGVIYESIAAANNTLPTDVTKWIAVGGSNASIAFSNVTVVASAAQAAQPTITATGVLTANVQLTLPARLQRWHIVNNTTGNFSLTVKTAAGTGVIVPASGSLFVYGDGTNIKAMPGQYLGTLVITATGVPTLVDAANRFVVRLQGGGAGGGGAAAGVGASQCASGAGGGAGGAALKTLTRAQILGQTFTIGAAGVGGVNSANGTNGGTTSCGAIFSAAGGTGGTFGPVQANTASFPYGSGNGGGSTGGDLNYKGVSGLYAFYGPGPISGKGGDSTFGGGADGVTNYATGLTALVYGAGGSGGNAPAGNAGGASGGNGFQGCAVIDQYS